MNNGVFFFSLWLAFTFGWMFGAIVSGSKTTGDKSLRQQKSRSRR